MGADPAQGCPCGSGEAYGACCGPLHDGGSAATAESLMRARYSAWALARVDYLTDSWHPQTRPAQLPVVAGTRWLGLTVRNHRVLGADQAEVEFVARYRHGGGRAVRLHERSRFVRERGRWYYLDGEIDPG